MILQIILPIFGVMALGWVSRRFNVIKKQASLSLNDLVYYFALPFLILRGILNLQIEELLDIKLLGTNVLAIAILTGIVALVTAKILKLQQKSVAMFIIAAYFGNVAYIGIPFGEAAFGTKGGAIASLIAVLVTIIAVLFGLSSLHVASGEKSFSPKDAVMHVLKLPIIWATVLGLIIVFSKISLPVTAHNLISLLAQIAGPLALFSLGMFIFENKFSWDFKSAGLLAFFNLLALPAVVFALGSLIGLTGLAFKVSIIQAGMPLATTNFVFARKFHVQEQRICEAIVLSALVAPFTLAFLLWVVGKL